MSERMDIYNSYVDQEDTLYERLETLEQCQVAVLDHMFRYGDPFHRQMVEEVLLNVHQLEVKVRLELLHLRLEKAFLAYELKTK